MNIEYDKIRNLLERVTSGNAGEVYINFSDSGETCTITWKRPKNLVVHKSWESRIGMLLYVKGLLMDVGVGVRINIETTEEDFLPED